MGDSSASLVLSENDPFTLETKPHGHGDVHHLLLREGVAETLKRNGFEWLFFFQDTNALVGIPYSLVVVAASVAMIASRAFGGLHGLGSDCFPGDFSVAGCADFDCATMKRSSFFVLQS